MQEIIYHYTSGTHLEEILQSGELKVSKWEKENKVKPPALWLSLNSEWENSATKLVSGMSGVRKLTKTEQFEEFGLVRFSLPFDKDSLCSWGKYRYKSNTPPEMYYQMERSGIDGGANPLEWYASFKNISLKKCICCEKWNGKEWELIKSFNSSED